MGWGRVCSVRRLLCLVVRALAGAVPCPPTQWDRQRPSLAANYAIPALGKVLLYFHRGEILQGGIFLILWLFVYGGGYVCGEG